MGIQFKLNSRPSCRIQYTDTVAEKTKHRTQTIKQNTKHKIVSEVYVCGRRTDTHPLGLRCFCTALYRRVVNSAWAEFSIMPQYELTRDIVLI